MGDGGCGCGGSRAIRREGGKARGCGSVVSGVEEVESGRVFLVFGRWAVQVGCRWQGGLGAYPLADSVEGGRGA